MKRWRLLEKKRNLDIKKKEITQMNDKFMLEWNTRDMVKQELLHFANNLKVGLYLDNQ